jgi:phosphoserine phosphatase
LHHAPPGAFFFAQKDNGSSVNLLTGASLKPHCQPRIYMSIELVILDVDGVIKEVVDPYSLLHRHFGTEEEGRRHFQAFLDGCITYHEFAQLDAWSWRGQRVDEIKNVLRSTPYVPGAFELADGLRARGIPFVLLSSGFDLNVEDVAADMHADAWRCNILHNDRGRIVGSMTVRVPYAGKGPIVREIIQRWDVDPAHVLAVGDSDTDILAFDEVGHAIAVRPRSEAVSRAADVTLPDLQNFLSILDNFS